jgi:hypothetical protein
LLARPTHSVSQSAIGFSCRLVKMHIGSRRGDQHGHRHADYGPERGLLYPVEGVAERARCRGATAQQHDNQGNRGDAVLRCVGGQQSERCDGGDKGEAKTDGGWKLIMGDANGRG